MAGASASGKTEVSKLLRKEYGIVKAVTHTTRSPRPGEKNGVDYFFVTVENFLELKAKGYFVETTFYNGHYYGCSKAQISDDKCVVVDPNGLRSFLALNDRSVVSFLLLATEATRRERMLLRGDKPEDIEKRLAFDRVDFDPSNLAPVDFRIMTDDRSIEEVANDVYLKYFFALKARGIAFDKAIQ